MKLLRKTVRGYLIYSVFILLIAIPAFYLTFQQVLQHETDEELMATKIYMRPKLEKAISDSAAFHFLDDYMSVAPATGNLKGDSLYTVDIFDTIEKDIIPFRFIRSTIDLKGKPYVITRRISLLEKEDLIKTILIFQIILLILLLGGLFVINRRLSLKIWRPFYLIMDKLHNYRVETQRTLKLPSTGITEFNDLKNSLENLAERSHQTFISQKEFTENASHEMQTPLAIMRGKLELLMQTSPLNEEQANLIDELADAGQRMMRLNKSLILLTKIENNQFQDQETVDLKNIVENFIYKQYTSQLEQKRIIISADLKSNIQLHANRMLIEILVSNLLGNAIRHNNEGGSIYIIIGNNLLTVKNNGRTTELDTNKIFTRFQKDGTDANSLGLGLEIARKICDLYHYQFLYSFTEGFHQFTVQFSHAND